MGLKPIALKLPSNSTALFLFLSFFLKEKKRKKKKKKKDSKSRSSSITNSFLCRLTQILELDLRSRWWGFLSEKEAP